MIQIYDLNAIQDQEIFLRRDEVRDVSAPVADIIRTVRAEGDRALYEYGRRFDGAELSGLSVTGAELEAALERLARFEDMALGLEAEQGDIAARLAALREQGKDKTAQFRELLAQKLSNANMLLLLERWKLR